MKLTPKQSFEELLIYLEAYKKNVYNDRKIDDHAASIIISTIENIYEVADTYYVALYGNKNKMN